MSDPDNTTPDIVGIGASAGGVEALSHFFDALPDETGQAYVIILHLLPDRKSHLADVLQQHTGMPVMEAEEGGRLAADHVYVIPPGKQLDLVDGELHVADADDATVRRSPIDRFFRTLAAVNGARAVGIVLSGSGSDGTLGVKAIKEAGGLVMVQSPEGATYGAMPRNALATGVVDVSLPAHELAEKVRDFSASSVMGPQEVDPADLSGTEAGELRRILNALQEETGHDFRHYRESTVLRRIARRMQVTGVETYAGYLEVLQQDPDEPDNLLRDLLITVTRFFRDPEAFRALEQTVIPDLFEDKTETDEVRVWVVGCATGEEAYSLGMLLLEHAHGLDHAPHLHVFATDISREAIATARKGIYPDTITADVSPERLQRFFRQEGSTYRVKDTLRSIVLFAEHNLLATPPFSRLDLISCRNLLIYLNRDVQERVFHLFHYALRPKSYLFLGTSEGPVGTEDLFTLLDKEHRLFQVTTIRKPQQRLPDLPLTGTLVSTMPVMEPPETEQALSPARLHQSLIEAFTPPSVLVNQEYKVIHFSSGASRFLQQPEGAPTWNILEMVPPAMQVELRTLLYKAFQDRITVVSRLIPLHLDQTAQHVRLTVRTDTEERLSQQYALVVFELVNVATPEGPTDPIPIQWPDDAAEVIRKLENELRATEEQLQTSVQQYATSNEELKSSNEELQSINEELKSATEELETSKEELHSTNEELLAVNQEYKAKIEELAEVNTDLRNLMEATDIGILFLDRTLGIKRFTETIAHIFNVTSSDLGRPLEHFTHHLRYPKLVEDVRRVLQREVLIQREVPSTDAAPTWYLVRMRPYQSHQEGIDGVVVTFVDITHQKDVEARLSESQQRLQALVNNALDVILLADDEARYIDCNPAAVQVLGYSKEELCQMRVADVVLGVEAEAFEAIWAQFIEAGTMEGEYQLKARDGRVCDMEFRAVANILPGVHLSVLRDVTERKKHERMVGQQAKIINEIHDSVIITDLNGVIQSVNKGGQTLLGYPDEELIGQHVSVLYPADQHDFLEQGVIGPVLEKGTHQVEVTMHTKEGERVHTDLALSLLRDESGAPVAMAGYARDITDRKQAEQALAAAKERIGRILESISEGFLVIDNQDRLLYINDRAVEIWGAERGQLVGARIWDIFPKSESQPFYGKYIEVVQTREPASVEGYFPPLDRWFTADLYPFEDGVSVYFRDVTERRRLEQEIIRIQEQAQRRIGRNLHDGLASLLSGLAMIGRGVANRLAQGEPVDPGTMEELVRQARSGAEQARSMAHGLNPVKLEEQGLQAALRELCGTVQVLSNLSCSCTVTDDLPSLSGAEHHLYRIAQEAALNAVRHAQASHIDLRLESDNGDVVLTVEDDGIGIDASGQNGGMGLHTMEYRAHLLGATLQIEATSTGGTRVVCRLPTS
jgi:two-component system CheB/CheR fusion protein